MAKSKGQKRRREAEAGQEQQVAAAESQDAPPSKKSRIEDRKSLFVRSLPPTATNETLTEFFSQHYPVKHATVITDPKTKTCRGYGFVTFTDPEDAVEAKEKLNNELFESRRLRLDIAEPRHRAGAKASGSAVRSKVAEERLKREEDMASSRKPPKLIVRNLPWSIKESGQLAALFQRFGKIKYADLPNSKGKLTGFGFVTMRARRLAQRAMDEMNGKEIDGRTIAVDWAVSKEEWQKQQSEAQDPEEGDQKSAKSTSKSKDNDGDEDQGMDQADKDLANFFREHQDDLESEDENDGEEGNSELGSDEEDNEDEENAWESADSEDDAAEEEKPRQMTDNSTTIFIRNLPFTTTDESLKEHFKQFGPVRYARVVMDKTTDRPAGTGFVCFVKMDDFKACLRSAPHHRPAVKTAKPSVLQDETVDSDGRYTLDGRVLQIAQAVSKGEATRLAEAGTSARKGQEKDKRRVFLLSEGTIAKNSPLYALLTPAEVKLREQSARQRKKQIQSNPSLHLSLTRLAIRNIPRNMGSKELKALAREAVVGFAKNVKAGNRQPLSKEELARGGQGDKEAERHRKEKGKGVVKQAKIVFESKEGSKVDEKTGAGRSRGYGFIEYSSHRWALMGLRWLNGHPLKNEAGKTVRLVVEFAIENVQVVSRRRASEEKSRHGRKAEAANDEVSEPGSQKKGKASKAKDQKADASEEADEAEEGRRSKKDPKEKLAQRQRIIGRKRMLRKEKRKARRAGGTA